MQADKLQMKSRSAKFPKIHLSAAKTATGNGNLQTEIKSNEYSSTRGSPNHNHNTTAV